jgi:hypothetical protein
MRTTKEGSNPQQPPNTTDTTPHTGEPPLHLDHEIGPHTRARGRPRSPTATSHRQTRLGERPWKIKHFPPTWSEQGRFRRPSPINKPPPPHADLRSPTTAFSTHGTSPPPHHHRKTAARRKSSVASAGEGAARRPLSPITGGHCAGR